MRKSRPIKIIDATNEIEPSKSSREDSVEEEPPLKRLRTKSNLVIPSTGDNNTCVCSDCTCSFVSNKEQKKCPLCVGNVKHDNTASTTEAAEKLRRDLAELVKKKEISRACLNDYNLTYTDEECGILAEVFRTTTSLENIWFPNVAALRNDEIIKALGQNCSLKSVNLNNIGCRDDDSKAIGAILRENSTIEEIVLTQNYIRDEGTKGLAGALKQNTTLSKINLSCNLISHVGVAAIADALQASETLQELNLNHNKIGDEGTSVIANALKESTTLKEIYLGNNEICSDGAKEMAEALKANDSLQMLDLSCNNIRDVGTIALAKALETNKTLQMIDLRCNQIKKVGAAAIADALKENTALKQLVLGANCIGDKGANTIAEALKENKTLQEIHLNNNNIGEKGAAALAEALKMNSYLQVFDVKKNQIKDAGAESLAEALKENTSVKELHLGFNKIGDKGTKAIAEALRLNTTLQTMNFHSNQISDEGAEALADALKVNSSLQYLCLIGNQISDEGAEAIADALKENITLKNLRLLDNNIGEKGAKDILNALQQNKRSSIENLNLNRNQVSKETLEEIMEKIKGKTEHLINPTTLLLEAESERGGLDGDDNEDETSNDMSEALPASDGNAQLQETEENTVTETELQQLQSNTAIGQHKKEIDLLKDRMRKSRPIKIIDATNEIEPSKSSREDSVEEEPPLKRRVLEQRKQVVDCKIDEDKLSAKHEHTLQLLSKLSAERDELSAKQQQTRQQLDNLSADNAQFQHRNQELENQNTQMQTQLDDYKLEMNKVSQQGITLVKKKSEEIREQLRHLKCCETKLDKLSAELQQAKQQLGKVSAERAELLAERDEMSEKQQLTALQLDNLSADNAQLQHRNQELLDETNQFLFYKLEMEKLSADREHIMHQLEKSSTENAELWKSNTADRQRMKQQMDTLSTENAQLQKSNKELLNQSNQNARKRVEELLNKSKHLTQHITGSEELDKYTKCCVCLEPYEVDPDLTGTKRLPIKSATCAHSLCEECLDGYHATLMNGRSSVRYVKCPQCNDKTKKAFDVQNKIVDLFLRDYIMMSQRRKRKRLN